jgi:Tol biopolymer transport system component
VTTDAPQISDDGRYVLFGSRDARLVRNDTNRVGDVFVRDLRRGTVRLVSVDSRRDRAAGGKRGMLSADGRVAAFMAHRRLVERDRDTAWDVYARDLRAGRTFLASPPVPGAGTTRTGSVRTASISGEGRYVVVNSQSTDLALGDADTRYDTFVRDTVARTTTLVSVGPDGRSGPGNAYGGDISRDGSCVAFTAAAASNLVPEDTNRAQDVYLRIRGVR